MALGFADATMRRMRRGRRSLTVLALAALGAAAGCRRPAAPARDPSQNVLLVTIDTLRADAIGAYGNANASTPGSTVWPPAASALSRPHARRRHAAVARDILSGEYPLHHGVRENSGFRFPQDRHARHHAARPRLSRPAPSSARFRSTCASASTAGSMSTTIGLGKATAARVSRARTRRHRHRVAALAARRWSRPSAPSPWFAWVHLYEPHFPYTPPEPYASRYRTQPYLGEVAAADAAVGALVDGR